MARGALGRLLPKLGWSVPLLLLWGAQATYCQQNLQSPQQTNQKIQQMAILMRSAPVDAPVGAGDLLHIDVFDVPELSRDVRVGEGGAISFPLIPGKIEAAGQTPFQLEQKLEELLVENGLVSHPQVSVLVREQNSQPVSVVGAVKNPKVYQVMRPTTLLEVLADAGGISDDAGDTVVITRAAAASEKEGDPLGTPAGAVQTIAIRLQDLLESGNPAFNVPVYGGDVVSVTRAGIVYVMGAGVAQPGGYVLQGHGEAVTVLKALALAHGLNSYAKANDSVILRVDPATGKREEIRVQLKRIEDRKAQDLAMKSNDILYVPDSMGKKLLAKGAESALGIGSAVAIYRTAYTQ